MYMILTLNMFMYAHHIYILYIIFYDIDEVFMTYFTN